MTLASNACFHATTMARGMDRVVKAGGSEPVEWISKFPVAENNQLFAREEGHEAFCARLAKLALDIIRDDCEVSELAQAGAWMLICWAAIGRETVVTELIGMGVIELAVAELNKVSPTDWLSWRTSRGVVANTVMHLGFTLSTCSLPGKTQLLLDEHPGFIDVAITVLKAYELRGHAAVAEATPGGIVSIVMMLSSLDLASPDAAPIVRLLETVPSAVQFLLSHPVYIFQDFGHSSAAHGSIVCALAFGKQEESDFTFSLENIEGTINSLLGIFSGSMAPFSPVLPPFFLRPIVHLCISSRNVDYLVRCSGPLLALLNEAMCLDPEHARNVLDDEARAAIQRDSAESLLQLALYEQGKQVLVAAPVVLQSLNVLAQDALTEDAKLMAHGALQAIGEIEHELDPHIEGPLPSQWIMMSYQWE